MTEHNKDGFSEGFKNLRRLDREIEAGDGSPEKRQQRRDTAHDLAARISAGKAQARAAIAAKKKGK
ncbi:hypothetical protein R3F64_03245 [Halomonas sp. 5021]|uniref:hypothetical protein n=1 Tax=Halomonas sp. 5021 TaxID=3082156 RepID=UPI002FC9BC63